MIKTNNGDIFTFRRSADTATIFDNNSDEIVDAIDLIAWRYAGDPSVRYHYHCRVLYATDKNNNRLLSIN